MGEGPWDASKVPGTAAWRRAAALSLCRVPVLFILFCFRRARVPALSASARALAGLRRRGDG